MEILGTNLSITLGSWRMRFCVAIEDIDAPELAKPPVPHRVRIVRDDNYQRRNA